MNKKDFILIFFIILLAMISYLIMDNKNIGSYALISYDGKLVIKVPLNINEEYKVDGVLGEVLIKVYNNKIKVTKENSPRHLCSKQGYISKQGEILICLPNKVVIEIESDNNEIDSI